MIKKIALGLLIVIALAGCPSKYGVKVDSMMADNSMKKYFLRSEKSTIKESSLEFKEYRTYIDRGLKFVGYTPVDSLNKAEIIIIVSYGDWYRNADETINVISKVDLPGHDNVSVTTLGLYYLSLDAFDMKTYTEKQEGELWKTSIRNKDREWDSMREAFPYLVAGIVPHIGAQSQETYDEDVIQDGAMVQRIRGEAVTAKR